MTGLRLPIDSLKRKVALVRQNARADSFKPELMRYAKRVLQDCVEDTPIRSESLITTAQRKQYELRVNYIPTNHRVENPTLIVKPNGQWLFMDGKWYRPDIHRLPAAVWARYKQLEAERNRRLRRIGKSDFVNQRKQARFLYQKSWHQVAQSIGVSLNVSGPIRNAITRRRPKKEPARGYSQIRGGGRVLSIVIRNDFLEQPSRYKPFSGRSILARAERRHRAQFRRECNAKAAKFTSDASKR